MDFRGPWLERGVLKRSPASKENFIRSLLVALESIFLDFECFHKISSDFIVFPEFQGSEVGNELRRVKTESCIERKLYSIPVGCFFFDFC